MPGKVGPAFGVASYSLHGGGHTIHRSALPYPLVVGCSVGWWGPDSFTLTRSVAPLGRLRVPAGSQGGNCGLNVNRPSRAGCAGVVRVVRWGWRLHSD